MTLRRLTTHAELLEASGDDPFIRYDVPTTLEHPGAALGAALALPRRTHTRRLGLLVMGPPDDAGHLLAAMARQGRLDANLGHVTVSHGTVEAVGRHLPLGDGNEWEWMYAVSAPPCGAGEDRLTTLSEHDLADIAALLELANPGTDARPFQFPDQQWVGARDEAGGLVACGVREPNLAGWPVLSGITVHPSERGRGLGRAVTARLTRDAVRDRGVCTLGLYSHNAVARGLYRSLRYTGTHRWSSRRIVADTASRAGGELGTPATGPGIS